MPFIPSAPLEPFLQRARIGVWVDPLPDGRVALVCKIPDTIIKAVLRGCQCTFTAAGPPWTNPAYLALTRNLLSRGNATLHLLNELTHPALSAGCTLEPKAAAQALEELSAAPLYVLSPSTEPMPSLGTVARRADLVMNRFQELLYQPEKWSGGTSSRMAPPISLNLDVWKPIEVIEITETTEGGPFRIDDEDEGAKLERELHLALGRIYPDRTYLSPKVGDGATTRELTDILAFDARFLCVVESKVMSALNVSLDRSSKRRAATVRKQFDKALRQLRGALVALRSDGSIRDDGEPIVIPHRRIAPAHAIVLLSHMYSFVDWRAIAAEILAVSEDERYKALFHVMDLQEFVYLAERSIDSEQFSGFLMQRWLSVKERGTVYGRAKMRSELPDDHAK